MIQARLKSTGFLTKYSNFCVTVSPAYYLSFNIYWSPDRYHEGPSDRGLNKVMSLFFRYIQLYVKGTSIITVQQVSSFLGRGKGGFPGLLTVIVGTNTINTQVALGIKPQWN